MLGNIFEPRNVIASMVVHSIRELASHREPGILKVEVTRGVTNEIVIHAEDVEGGIPGIAFGMLFFFW